ncbi:hypothetical protein CTheo_5103 [Ceratobasidium theobromae]|uniref:Uncharacterized protein n=1 Tax=Ceratobasidium theobromae TaxID=1582974 RepID=A0A5N5QIZ6_9AGAM|nr:hypothetical protein CTheo_5103 [Ceratobasidium theobromae]
MHNKISDGVYSIQLPHGSSAITDPGEGRWLNLMHPGELGKDADKIEVRFNQERGAYSFKFAASKKYITYEGEPSTNNKLCTGDKPRYFRIVQHEYYPEQYVIYTVENMHFHFAIAFERIFPPWVAMISGSDKQPWDLKKQDN